MKMLTELALDRLVQAQLHHPNARELWQRRWWKRWQIHGPLLRRFQHNPVDLYDWNRGLLYQGLVAYSRRTGVSAPAELVAAIGRENRWEIGLAPWRSWDHPDDFAVGGAYVALSSFRPEPGMLDPLRRRVQRLLTSPDHDPSWWIDALAMAPPTWADLACHDGKQGGLQLAAARTLQVGLKLHSPQRGLFFRDERQKRRAFGVAGAEVFWGRGNGWAVAGLARVLAHLPAEDRHREPLLRLYRDTLDALMARRTADGQLPTDLSQPQRGGETSATALLVFAVARGINTGLLDRQRWQEPILFSWEHLLLRVTPSGELADVQPPGDAPAPTLPRSLHPFAAGVVLLAGEEVLTLLSFHPAGATNPPACSTLSGVHG